MQIDLDKMLDKIKSSQWALADIDWEAPGAERITDEQWPRLKAFMADLMWIEHVGARGFAAMARKAPTDTLRQIYHYFHAEEQRHANAEMALMKRWGMLDGEGIPEPNINLRLVIDFLDTYGDDLPLNALASVIPTLEIALDGALLKFLEDTVEDPVFQQALKKINADEARHLGVGFHVLEMMGHGPLYRAVLRTAGEFLSPKLLVGIMVYLPLLNRMRDNIMKMGLSEEKLYEALRKFTTIGGRTADGRRNPWFHILSWHSRMVANSRHPYHLPMNALVKLSDHYPRRLLRKHIPTWVRQLTWKTAA